MEMIDMRFIGELIFAASAGADLLNDKDDDDEIDFIFSMCFTMKRFYGLKHEKC